MKTPIILFASFGDASGANPPKEWENDVDHHNQIAAEKAELWMKKLGLNGQK